ncbi:hypothetical protein EST38_g4813 [Candolleomyces aberdarensis]|uniref:Uncharacterized protein n=1 Tax=Candolleomyces aberdarensis TaxID=2316362 RepID=A0A4Q2DNZ7_9AGAR|nr:hypothetical protein EST38_g4813 [Candolleomyces aberdarensis]
MENTDLIENALTSGQAFVLPPIRAETTTDESEPEALEEPAETPAEHVPVEGTSDSADSDAWREEYEAQVQAWREQSAEAREKAEKERARWEAIRAEDAAKRKSAGIIETPAEIPTGIPNTHSRSTSLTSSAQMAETKTAGNEPESRGETTDDGSQKWEDVQASTSSFPSSFPERTEPSSPTPQVTTSNNNKPAPTSATLVIFDSTLSTKTRVLALFSALAINLALPFVNGVMLGFGEIFAKNVVLGWFGWKPVGPGSVAGTAGLRSASSRPSPFR